MLFATVMISDAALSSLVYVSPAKIPRFSPRHPTMLALQTLRILSHLSFVITHFGGVTATSKSSFQELKRVFYTALDLSATDEGGQEAEILVIALKKGKFFK
jgi:hypothetical protein